MRILYIHASFVPPPANPQDDRFFLLSDRLEGEILQPLWWDSPDRVETQYGPGTYPTRMCGKFRYHWFLAWKYTGIRRKLELFRFYVNKAVELNREKKIDCIVVYSHQMSGVMASIAKLLTGAKLAVEIATTPDLVHLVNRPVPTPADRLQQLFSDTCLHISSLASDRLHLLSPDQMSAYPLLRRVPGSVFHEFVPVSAVQRGGGEAENPYILFVGAPWFLKGVDLLIGAFLKLAPDFPDVRLKLLGHFPDRSPIEAMAAGSDRVEILKALPYPEALKLISGATVLVLPSRCEGMGRVLIEAMAAGVPVIGSDVGGIPYMIRDGVDGYVFPRGDAQALESKLRLVLGDKELRQRLGENGYRRAHADLNEKAWVDGFADMVEAAVSGNTSRT